MKGFRILPIRDRVAVLASGGLDSSVMLADLARRGRHVFPVYIRAGLKWERVEMAILRRFIARLSMRKIEQPAILELPMTDLARAHWSVTGKNVPGFDAPLASNYIPGRNLSLLAKASVFCALNRIGRIAIAPLQSNPFPDARPQFFRAFERAASLGLDLPLKVIAPFAGMEKSDVIRRGRGLPLQLTLSCARPRGMLHCGACTKCAERIEGFREAGVADPTRYAENRITTKTRRHEVRRGIRFL